MLMTIIILAAWAGTIFFIGLWIKNLRSKFKINRDNKKAEKEKQLQKEKELDDADIIEVATWHRIKTPNVGGIYFIANRQSTIDKINDILRQHKIEQNTSSLMYGNCPTVVCSEYDYSHIIKFIRKNMPNPIQLNHTVTEAINKYNQTMTPIEQVIKEDKKDK